MRLRTQRVDGGCLARRQRRLELHHFGFEHAQREGDERYISLEAAVCLLRPALGSHAHASWPVLHLQHPLLIKDGHILGQRGHDA